MPLLHQINVSTVLSEPPRQRSFRVTRTERTLGLAGLKKGFGVSFLEERRSEKS